MNTESITIENMKSALGDLVMPGWDDVQIEQLYRILMDVSAPPVLVNLAASGFKLGGTDQEYWKPIDRNVI